MNNSHHTQSNNLNKDDLTFLRNKTNINQNLILEYYEKFAKKFPSGQVSRSQFESLIKAMLIVNFSQGNDSTDDSKEIETKKLDMCDRMWNICDHDEDGYIDFKEYLVLFWARISGSKEEKLSLIFEMFDSNHSGYLDFHEVHSIVKILFKLKYSDASTASDNDQTINKHTDKEEKSRCPVVFNSNLPQSYHISMDIMKKFDTDKNAKLTKEEFIKGCLTHENIHSFLTPLKFF